MNLKSIVNTDCIEFNGYKPCRPHKEDGILCGTCLKYKVAYPRILVIKTGAAGEVIRCTALLRKIRAVFPDAEVTWVTKFPDLVPRSLVDRIWNFDWSVLAKVQVEIFDILYSLDKESDACAIANLVRAKEKKGFGLNDNGRIVPLDPDAVRKWSTGIRDDLLRTNFTGYPEEIFEICGFDWQGEEYVIDGVTGAVGYQGGKIGLNTGAGQAWRTRLWGERNWLTLALKLKRVGFDVYILGGKDEHDMNVRIAKESESVYNGVGSFGDFFKTVAALDVVVTSVTMALHAAVGLKRRVVLLNNIFWKYEFWLYERGVVVEPDVGCLGCYKTKFDENCIVPNCMELISVEAVYDAVLGQIELVKKF